MQTAPCSAIAWLLVCGLGGGHAWRLPLGTGEWPDVDGEVDEADDIVWPPAAPGRQLSSTGMAGCRNDICRDTANDCCAPGAEARGCAGSGYGVFPHGTSSYGQCVSRFGANAVYSCCPAQSCDSGCDRSCDSACNGSCDTCYVLFIFACNGEYPRNRSYCSSHPRYPDPPLARIRLMR